MTDPVFHKTERGQDEIRTRARKLDHKLRALLLIVNGERRRSELLAQTGGMGVGAEAIEALLEAGLIRAAEQTDPARPPAGSDSSPANPAQANVRSTGDGKADAAVAPAQDLPSSAGGQVRGTYQQLYHFYTDVIGHHLGLRGYLLQVKVEKAGSPTELAALRDPLYTALHKAKGEITAGAIIGQLDRLVRDGWHASA
ncbi:hypothetical protein P3W85_11440 [Cupriavidus basilensis]|uniref:Proline-rich protein n=1 Tax=Cupriavidus basilensis TaxID=68895 RepID=A0ABT6ALR9_9BURK|nr:hypothetical protein [Cupriavidus basilensis]MDF3833556.1 hypothetical protein [Cupriavidus basilensis]